MLSTVLYYELAMKVPNPVGITVYLLTWGLGHLRCLVMFNVVSICATCLPVMVAVSVGSLCLVKLAHFLLQIYAKLNFLSPLSNKNA